MNTKPINQHPQKKNPKATTGSWKTKVRVEVTGLEGNLARWRKEIENDEKKKTKSTNQEPNRKPLQETS